jgi:hypothetical protein
MFIVVLGIIDFALQLHAVTEIARPTLGVACRRGATVKFGSLLYRWTRKREYCINCLALRLHITCIFLKISDITLPSKKNLKKS